MKHPFYNTTTESALDIARNMIYGPIPKKSDPVPSIDEAIRVIDEEHRTCGFNWITGTACLQVLRASRGEKVDFTS
jgi:hypothetical protein